MLNTFPNLLTLSFIAPFILRVFVGSYFIKLAWVELIKYKKGKIEAPRPLKILSAVGGLLLVIGFLTQVTSIFLILIIFFNLIGKLRHRKLNSTAGEEKLDFYILILGVLLSLVLSGAGFLAIDIPL
ncbi:hypothetical protein KJ603_00990 [Patescibacteria group bacterium]|nr:hypothetical protein [Patescibacteria group bacterium]